MLNFISKCSERNRFKKWIKNNVTERVGKTLLKTFDIDPEGAYQLKHIISRNTEMKLQLSRKNNEIEEFQKIFLDHIISQCHTKTDFNVYGHKFTKQGEILNVNTTTSILLDKDNTKNIFEDQVLKEINMSKDLLYEYIGNNLDKTLWPSIKEKIMNEIFQLKD